MTTAASTQRPTRGPCASGEPVADRAADGAADGHRQKWQHGVKRAGFQIQPAHLGQVDIEPAEENPGDIAETKIAERDRDYFPAREHSAPGHKVGLPLAARVSSAPPTGCTKPDWMWPALLRHQRMLRRRIAGQQIPDRSSHQTDHGAHPERSAPAIVQHEVGDQWRGKAGAGADAGKNPAVGDAALLRRNPARNKLVRCRINYRLPRSQQKADCDKQKQRARMPAAPAQSEP